MLFPRLSLIIFFSLACKYCYSQHDSLAGKDKTSSNLKLAYNSSLIHPGLRAGFEFPLKTTYKSKEKKSGKEKDIVKDQFITSNLSWYHHTHFHDNIYFTAGWTLRRTKVNGYFTEFSPEMGYSRTFLGGTTYTVNDNGEVVIKKWAGYNYALVSIGGGFGYDFSIKKSKPFMVFYKLNLLTMYPYNSTFYLRPAMEAGFVYKPSDFLSIKKRIKGNK